MRAFPASLSELSLITVGSGRHSPEAVVSGMFRSLGDCPGDLEPLICALMRWTQAPGD